MTVVRTLRWAVDEDREHEQKLLSREWLVTNGLGGYASGTISDIVTRRYHGLLVAALPAPLGRVMMLNDLLEQVRLPSGRIVHLGGKQRGGGLATSGSGPLREFRLEAGLPVWQYEVGEHVLERRVLMTYRQNTVHVLYSVTGPGALKLILCPALHFRSHDGSVSAPLDTPYGLTILDDRYEITGDSKHPQLRIRLTGGRSSFTVDRRSVGEIFYRVEESRGYEHKGDLWTPGWFEIDVAPGQDAALMATTESWERAGALEAREALAAESERRSRLLIGARRETAEGFGPDLVLASDQFVVRPAGRVLDEARAHAAGYDSRTVIAGYHWFTDWGRDTMISLEGLALATGRWSEARAILRTFAYYVKDGLIPNMFPEGQTEAVYNTADATLWFFHAIDRYLAVTGDSALLDLVLPKLVDIIEHHVNGTRFGIGVDPADGLLRQGAPDLQLTWMDAKVGDWVVTPRRGKAVEINALWYNALALMAAWMEQRRGAASATRFAARAAQARESFNARFWYARGGYLYDVVDGESGDDPACRPNQLFAISLSHPVLEQDKWAPVLDVVRARLLTPVGLRTLSPDHPDYKARYYGDLRSRDAAYHQGTVWPWLLGAFVDAHLRVNPSDKSGARRALGDIGAHLEDACIGTFSEIFDAEPPFTPRGCVAQAWSVAELLRAWVRTAPEPTNP